MAQRIVTSVALLGFLAWSLVGLVALGLVSLGGDILRFVVQLLFSSNIDALETAESIAHFLQALGGGLIVFVWVMGGIFIAIGASVFRRLSAVDVNGARFDWQPEPWNRREMKDVTPPRNRASDETLQLPRPRNKD
jgi:hypothetical protein